MSDLIGRVRLGSQYGVPPKMATLLCVTSQGVGMLKGIGNTSTNNMAKTLEDIINEAIEAYTPEIKDKENE